MHIFPLHRFIPFKTSLKLLTLLLLVCLADFLFYDHRTGWTLGLFAFCLMGAGFLFSQKEILAHRHVVVFSAAATGLVFALIEAPGPLAAGQFLLTIFSVLILVRNPGITQVKPLLDAVSHVVALAGIRLLRDSFVITRIHKRRQHTAKTFSMLRWVMPLTLSSIFITLFAQSNPVITRWLSAINWDAISAYIASYLSFPRLLFWGSVASVCWALIRPRYRMRARLERYNDDTIRPLTLTRLIFNPHS